MDSHAPLSKDLIFVPWSTVRAGSSQAVPDRIRLCSSVARGFEHFALKKEYENLHKQEVLNINRAVR